MVCSHSTDIDDLPDLTRLSIDTDDVTRLATASPTGCEVEVPPWAMQIGVQGERSEERIFALPRSNPHVWEWLYSRDGEPEVVPAEALAGSSTESTTLYRMREETGSNVFAWSASPSLSTHWFLCPSYSVNGVTLGFVYMDVLVNRLDCTCVGPLRSGRFALNNATGECFALGWTKDDKITVGWIQSVSTCERIRETLLADPPNSIGEPRGRLYLRNSFYDRRCCKICGGNKDRGRLPTPCKAPAAKGKRARRIFMDDSDFGDNIVPLSQVYRRFKGGYFGRVRKMKFDEFGRLTHVNEVSLYLDIRHAAASTNRLFRTSMSGKDVPDMLNPRSAVKFLPKPLLSNGLGDSHGLGLNADCVGTSLPPFTFLGGIDSSFGDYLHDISEVLTSFATGPAHGTAENNKEQAMRKRNADAVDRDTVLYKRKQRNRESARKANEERRKRLESQRKELDELKLRVPILRRREAELKAERERLRQAMQLQLQHALSMGALGIDYTEQERAGDISVLPDDFMNSFQYTADDPLGL